MELYHVLWQDGDRSQPFWGRVGVMLKTTNETLEIKRLAGPAPHAALLLPILNAALPEGWLETAKAMHATRRCPWRVERRIGMSGARDYKLRILVDPEWMNAPYVAGVHISMYGKLNEGFGPMWLGDVPPLLAAVAKDFPPPEEHPLEVFTPELSIQDFRPAEESGF